MLNDAIDWYGNLNINSNNEKKRLPPNQKEGLCYRMTYTLMPWSWLFLDYLIAAYTFIPSWYPECHTLSRKNITRIFWKLTRAKIAKRISMFSFLRRAKSQIKFKQFSLLSREVFKRLLYITILIYCGNTYGNINICFGPLLMALFCNFWFKRRFQDVAENTLIFSLAINRFSK